jgi:hypothetical protein
MTTSYSALKEQIAKLETKLEQQPGGVPATEIESKLKENSELKRQLLRIEGRIDWSIRLKGLREHAQDALVQLAQFETAHVSVFGQIEEIKKEDFETACGEGIAEFTKLIDTSKATLEAAEVSQQSSGRLAVAYVSSIGPLPACPRRHRDGQPLQVICILPAQLPLRIRSIIDSRGVKCRRQLTFQTAVSGEPRDHAPVTSRRGVCQEALAVQVPFTRW